MARVQCAVQWNVFSKIRSRKNCFAATSNPATRSTLRPSMESCHSGFPNRNLRAAHLRQRVKARYKITLADAHPRRLSLAARLSHAYRFVSSRGWRARVALGHCADQRRDRACALQNYVATCADLLRWELM